MLLGRRWFAVYLTAEEQELYKRIQQQAAEGWRKLKVSSRHSA